MRKWKELLSQITLNQTTLEGEAYSLEDCLKTELEEGIVLPILYKEFCQTFGTGKFGEFIKIFCPSPYFSRESRSMRKSLKECTEEYLKDLEEYLPQDSRKKIEKRLRLFDSCFVFGEDGQSCIALWDLTTYSKLDDSYDIYWLDVEEIDGDVYKVGRNFFEFVRDFCLGMEPYHVLPGIVN